MGVKAQSRILSTMSSFSPSAPSQPVVIPARARATRHGNRSNSKGSYERQQPSRAGNAHRSDGMPPSVAALLAVTSIPPPKTANASRRRQNELQRQAAVMSLLDESRIAEKDITPFGKSPMDVLMAPPDDTDEEDSNSTDKDAVLPSGSVSYDAVPALETDDESIISSSDPLTPEMIPRRALLERRGKSTSPLQVEECGLSHPLLSTLEDDDPLDTSYIAASTPISQQTAVSTRQTSSFKSNLTASIRALKSAARSFSSFAAPIIQPDDFLTRSIPYTDERRPLPLDDTPTPALRRYLNPTSNSPVHEAHAPHAGGHLIARDGKCTASIQMQTYKISRTSSPSRRASSSPIATTSSESAAAFTAGPVARQREVRENSDFLRVIVLEMNMRKRGKLSETAQGKARFILPPRRPGARKDAVDEGAVPSRWVGVGIDE